MASTLLVHVLMHHTFCSRAVIGFMVLAGTLAIGCAAEDEDDTNAAEDEVRAAKQGQTCGNGAFGTPKLSCGKGLECIFPASTAPTGPAGSSSALTGKCERRAKAGETCGNGTFGTPSIACASNLSCVFPPSTAPTGPAGSSSALTGKCQANTTTTL